MHTLQHSSGLVLAVEGMDEEAASRALKRLDRRLVLQKHPAAVEGGWVYKVVCVVSDNHAPVVLTWMDEHGRPLPLSSAIVDRMQAQYVGARNKEPDEDEHNARVRQELEKDRASLADAVVTDHRPYIERGRVSVGLSTRGPRHPKHSKPEAWRNRG